MKITLEILAGPNHDEYPTKGDIQINIDAIERAIEGKILSKDLIVNTDTKSILIGIQKKLPH